MKSRNRFFGIALLVAAILCIACGPFFPNMLLLEGDDALLRAPVGIFARELGRIKAPPTSLVARPGTNAFSEQTIQAEVVDLRSALKKSGVQRRDPMASAYESERRKLAEWTDASAPAGANRAGRAAAPDFKLPSGLPAEFRLYFEGSVEFHRGRTNEAREKWLALLRLPKEERSFRSVWAAYMLGRITPRSEPAEAIEWYRKTRKMAQGGFSDRLGLAAASLGWEARVLLDKGDYPEAMDLYLEQFASGDPTASVSLQIAAGRSLEKATEEQMVRLTRRAAPRRVFAALLLSREQHGWVNDLGRERAELWLKLLEDHPVDAEEAERFALIAYQNNQPETAQRWVKLCNRQSVAGRWIQAKLWAREGRVSDAARIMQELVREIPLEPKDPEKPARLADDLYVESEAEVPGVRIAHQLRGEWALLQLKRNHFVEALDLLLQGNFWFDAAYVAERVLTLDELKSYVDENWPEGKEPELVPADATAPHPGEAIRYLLARRWTRDRQTVELRSYYPEKMRGVLDQWSQALLRGQDESRPAAERAASFFEAAKLLREQGMELMGTEVEPDWHVHGGNFEDGPSTEWRDANTGITAPTLQEQDRTRNNPKADPARRFHYRYRAAFLGLDAANLMPDGSEETAKVLCIAGSWIKRTDPQTADIFYKALVRRCPDTEIGREAERIRWFPILDASGKVIPYVKRAPDRIGELP